jgi:hypothetical protein
VIIRIGYDLGVQSDYVGWELYLPLSRDVPGNDVCYRPFKLLTTFNSVSFCFIYALYVNRSMAILQQGLLDLVLHSHSDLNGYM